MYDSQKKLIHVAAICIVAFTASSQVFAAGISATSLINMTDFVIKGSNGNVLDAASDFGSLTFTGTADLVGNLGADTYADGSASAPINLPVGCAGACPTIGEDAFTVLSGAPSTNYSTSDQEEAGSPVANLPGFSTGAMVSNAAYVGIATGATTASGNSNNNLNSNWTFALNNDQPSGITFEFAMEAYLENYVDLAEVFPGFATASYQVVLTVTDVLADTKVFDWSPNGTGTIKIGTENADPFDINETISKNAPAIAALSTGGIHSPSVGSTGFFSATTLPLTAGTQYQLSARINVNTDGLRVEIPEEQFACRLTGGGVTEDDTWDGTLMDGEDGTNRYQFGGQVGANTGKQPQPKGEWQHHQQRGPAGSFSFHAGTASAKPGTEIVEIRCSDPGGCAPSGDPPSPVKQLDFDCIGTFSNLGNGNNAPVWLLAGANVVKEPNGNSPSPFTFHVCEVNIDDLGEGPDPDKGDDVACPPAGFGEKGANIEPANCDCPDFYRLTIYDGVSSSDVSYLPDGSIDPTTLNTTDVIYEIEGYLGQGGNGLQLHYPTGFDTK